MDAPAHPIRARRALTALIVGALAVAASGCCGVSSTGSCLRRATIRQAARAGDAGQLRSWLRDDRSWVREHAALAAGALSPPTRLVADMQARLLDRAEKPWVRAAAARAFAEWHARRGGAPGSDLGAAGLVAVAARPDTPPEVKIALVETVCRVDPGAGPTHLAPLRRDPDLLVASAAALQVQTQCGTR